MNEKRIKSSDLHCGSHCVVTFELYRTK